MKKFVWTITFEKKINFSEKNIKIVELENNTYYFFWKINLNSWEELVDFFSKYWKILDLDISFEWQEKIIFLNNKIEKDSRYELVSFEWELVNFEEILSRFEENFEVFCVREAEESEKFLNKIIKVDFFY